MRYDPDKEAYIRQPGGGAAPLSDELNFAYNLSWFENIWRRRSDTLLGALQGAPNQLEFSRCGWM